MQIKRSKPNGKRHWTYVPGIAEPEALSSLYYFFAKFVQGANENDISLLFQALAEWDADKDLESDDIDYFTTCIFRVCGFPLNTAPPTIAELQEKITGADPYPTLTSAAEALNVFEADYYERAFLGLCQAVYRETRSHPDDPRLLERVITRATKIAARLRSIERERSTQGLTAAKRTPTKSNGKAA